MIRRALSSPILALLALWALVVWPILRAGYPSIGDGLIHLYRLVEFDHLLRFGVWFPRWATDLCYGFGCPVFNFYPPGVYYLGAAFHALGLSYGQSLLTVYGLAFGLGLSGAYILAYELWGGRAGFIAACAYGFAPYLYFNALARGALPETFGLGLLPWVLWAYTRLARKPTAKIFIATTLLYAALILSHLLTALLAVPLIMAFAVIAAPRLAHRPPPTPPPTRCTVYVSPFSFFLPPSSFLLSLCLSAYFLLPAALETNAVQIHNLTMPGDLDYHNNFLTLSQLFAWPQTYDAKLVFIPVPPSLNWGVVMFILLMLGAGAAPSLQSAIRVHPRSSAVEKPALPSAVSAPQQHFGIWNLNLGILLLFFCAFTLPLTLPLWERLPLINLIQFPWRLVGPASLLLALLAAAAFHHLHLESWNLNLGPLQLGFGIWDFLLPPYFFFLSLTWTFAPAFSTPASPTLLDLTPYEVNAQQLGTTSTGEFLPKDVQQLPSPDSLRAVYAAQPIIPRLGPLPAGVTLVSQSATLTSASAVVNASAPATLTFNIFYFPGWQATLDGAPLALTPSNPHGLLTLAVPPGQHTVHVRFGSTPLRLLASILSLITLALLLFIAVRFQVWNLKFESWNLNLAPFPLLLLLSIRLLFIDGHDTIFFRSRFNGATLSNLARPLDVNFDNQLILLGLDPTPSTVVADDVLRFTLYWRAQNLPPVDYSTTLQVTDEFGNLYGQSDSQHPGRMPTSRWRLDQYARDEHRLTLLPGTPPGTYTLTVGVYQVDGAGLSVLDENQIPQGQAFVLGTITVTRAAQPPAQLDFAQPLQQTLGPLTLLGQSLNTTSPQAGDELRFTLFWQVGEAKPEADFGLRLELTALGGEILASADAPPARRDYATSSWPPHEIVRAPHHFRLPADVPAGPAQLRVSLLSPQGARLGHPTVIADLQVRVPERSFTLPNPQHPRAEVFNESLKLLGYDVTSTGLTLYWQALALMDTSYTAFVHTLDAEAHILNQVDHVPADGARPTTGWLPGEIITDVYAIDLSNAAQIEIGLYNPHTLERLGTIIFTP